MSPGAFWFWLFVLVVANQIVSGLFCRFLAYEKNRDGVAWFWLGFVFGPLPIALLTLIGLPVVPDDEANYKQRLRLNNRLAQFRRQSNEFRRKSNELRSLTLGDATALAQHHGALRLDGLSTLPDEAAEALSQHRGTLFLRGLTTLSDNAATSLARHRGPLLLDGLTTLSDDAVKVLREAGVSLPRRFKQ
jgi:hypothetical protein